MTWHVPEVQIDGYLHEALDPATASSIESHLTSCAGCRAAVADRTPAADLTASWAGVERRIDAAPDRRTDGLLIRLGIPDHDVRLLAPTRSLRWSWLGAVAIALVVSALLARSAPADVAISLGMLVFLLLASVGPLAGVAAALGSASEPAPEVAAAAPISMARILAVRATTVVAASVAIGLTAGLLLPGPWTDAGLWLLPSLAICTLGVALSGRFGPVRAAIGVSATWVFTVIVWVQIDGDRLAPFRPGPQLAYLVIAAVLGALIVRYPGLIESRPTGRARTTDRLVDPWSHS